MALPENRKSWLKAHPSLEACRSMKRRHDDHDYRGRCIYHITTCVANRRPVLGTLRNADDSHPLPWVELSDVGEIVHHEWLDIRSHRPEIDVLALQVMPDHVHAVLFVTRTMPVHLGAVISGVKAGIRKALRELQVGVVRGSASETSDLRWEAGYNDTILRHKGHLEAMLSYVRDNPRRLWEKRQNPQFFTLCHNLKIGGTTVMTMGNRHLLDYPLKVQVQCSRHATAAEVEALARKILMMASKGYVVVSPSISRGEKFVMKKVFEAGFRTIVLVARSLSPMDKPQGRQFDACMEGRLLLVALSDEVTNAKRITRQQCLSLNALAEAISARPAPSSPQGNE